MKTFLSFLILPLDQLLKFWFRSNGNFSLNPGMFMGFLSDSPVLAILINIVLIGILIFFYWKNSFNRVLLSLIIFSSVSNLIDRFLFGGVVDYIRFGQISVLNISDIGITIGIMLLIISIYYEDKKISSRKGI